MGAKPSLTADQLSVGRVYASKRPKAVGVISRYYDDRQILYIGENDKFARALAGLGRVVWVQYDSPTVKFGRKYPKVTLEKFLKWAGSDVTDQCPPGEWRTFPNGERQED